MNASYHHRARDLELRAEPDDTREPWGYDNHDYEWVWQVAVALQRGAVLWCGTQVKRLAVVAGRDAHGTYCVMVEGWDDPRVATTAFEVARAFVNLVGWQLAGFAADDAIEAMGLTPIPFSGC